MRISLDDPDLTDPYDPMPPLQQAVPLLRKGYEETRTQQFEAAILRVKPLLSLPLSLSQRRRVLYIIGMSHVHLYQTRAAIPFLDEALDLTNLEHDSGDVMALALLQAIAHHQLQSFVSSAKYYRIALSALHSESLILDAEDGVYELEILTGLAQQLFYLGKLPESSRALKAARRVTVPSAETPLKRAAAEWTASLVARWRSNPYAALEHAEAAFPIYQKRGSYNEIGRLHIVMADIHLDIASRGGSVRSSDSSQMSIHLAQTHLADALILVRLAEDPAAEGMAQLAYSRLQRVLRPGEDVSSLITHVMGKARQIGDKPLLGQSYTSLAQCQEDRHEEGSARDLYAQALSVFAATDAPILGIQATRALMRMSEPLSD